MLRSSRTDADESRRAMQAPNPVGKRAWKRLVGRYRRVVEPVVRGPLGVAVTVGVFGGAGAVGGRAGLMLASVWVLAMGAYCVANFLYCRETHCVVTGGGWIPVALLGLIAALAPAGSMSWYGPGVTETAFVVVLAAGHAFEWAVAARTGRHSLGSGRHDAQGC